MSQLSLLPLLQLTDSAFPSGRYTLSHGLESFAGSSELRSPVEPSLLRLLGDALRFCVAPSDGIALSCAHRAVGPDHRLELYSVVRADERLSAVKLAREPREASMRTGRALLRTALDALDSPALVEYAELVEAGAAPCNHAVVLGVVCAGFDVPRLDAVAGELYSFSASWVSAAVRLGLVDHGAAQRILRGAHPTIAAAADASVEANIDEIASSAPLFDAMAMRHEEAPIRVFAT
jgi:urease accessory protein